jgi:UDP-glucose 4-epimerase
MRVLVTGGAGYIGSVIASRLLAREHAVTVFDDLSRGHRSAVPHGAAFEQGDVRDTAAVTAAILLGRCEAVVHMAAVAEVAESVAHPQRYFDINLHGTETVLESALAGGVTRIVFSSTAAVYGVPKATPITEDAAVLPTSPYGESKLGGEKLLAAAGGDRLAVATLRYFNAAGAHGDCGEDHDPESHLIPLALMAASDGRPLHVFGTDYPTADGTCMRDYVHVADLADAHIAALEGLPETSGTFNLGTGTGNSVFEVLDAVDAVTGQPLVRAPAARRPGDPPVLVASCERAAERLGWRPRRTLADCVADAWRWMRAHPGGYAD